MANRVTVTVSVRDVTRAQLARMRHNFSRLGTDIDNAIGRRTRENFNRMSQSASQARRDLNALRGAIPDAEFTRLDDALQRAQRRLGRGFGNVGNRAFARIIDDLDLVRQGFRNLDEEAQISVRVDNSALRRADARLDAWRRQQSRNSIRPDVRPDTRNFSARLRNTLMAPLRMVGRIAGGILSDGIGQGIVSGFQRAGPVAATVFAGILAAIIAWLGAALAGVIVLAFGGAFATLGGFLAAQDAGIRGRFSSTVEYLKRIFGEAAKPLIPVLNRGITLVEQLGKSLQPVFARFIADAAPSIERFFQFLVEGFQRFSDVAAGPLSDAFIDLLDAFGPKWSDLMQRFGETFADLAQTVTDHADAMADAVIAIGDAIRLAVETVDFLAEAWGEFKDLGPEEHVAKTEEEFRRYIETLQISNQTTVLAADAAASLREQVDAQREAYTALIDKLNESNQATLTAMQAEVVWRDRMAELKEEVNGFNGQLKIKNGYLDLSDEKTRVVADKLFKMAAAAHEAANKIREETGSEKAWHGVMSESRQQMIKSIMKMGATRTAAKRLADAILGVPGGKSINFSTNAGRIAARIKAAQQSISDSISKINSGSILLGGAQAHGGVVGRYFGGNIGAAATGGVRNNMTLVGEQGPELVSLAPGSHVKSNPDTRRALRAASRGASANFVFKSSGRRVDDLLLEILREAIHQRGGDPVTVLGG